MSSQPENPSNDRTWLTRQIIEGVIAAIAMIAAGLVLYWLGVAP